MKNVRVIIIAIACICVICGGFYLFSQSLNSGNEDELTEIQKVLVKDLEKDYPKTPREVAKFYNRIVACYHDENTTEEQVGKLVDQMMLLFDEDMIAKNPRDVYYAAVVSDIELYKQTKKNIASMSVCDTNEVRTVTDDRNGDELAFVDVDYFVNTDGKFTNSYITIGLRKDADGKWKIVGVTLREGESSDDDE